jgi:hypothetical protein
MKMSRLTGLLLTFLIYAAITSAATLQQLSMDQVTANATSVVRARVVSSSASFTGSSIYTHYRLQVSETWKGAAETEVMLPGGVANGYRQSFPGVPQLDLGAEYVLFLWKSSSTGITHLIGLSQGLFNVTLQADGTVLASRPQIGETMLDATGRNVTDQAVQMKLSDMRNQVSRAGLAAGAVK